MVVPFPVTLIPLTVSYSCSLSLPLSLSLVLCIILFLSLSVSPCFSLILHSGVDHIRIGGLAH